MRRYHKRLERRERMRHLDTTLAWAAVGEQVDERLERLDAPHQGEVALPNVAVVADELASPRVEGRVEDGEEALVQIGVPGDGPWPDLDDAV